ncbi:hypothetical protein LCM4573_25005 [Rhizobium sp. LCM 4573]|nr:MbcA/ParS/Xre antitoxin family protein [Rhizobium sp. LCM 4573]OHV80252.1 hypothetical protein LCM4573_25005 [Rhizobium sp. LCM 4573]
MLQEIPRTEAVPEIPQITAREAEAMGRAVIRLFEKWQVSDADAREILGGLAARTYARWKAGELGRIDRDLATRLSLLLGIHKGLRYLFSDPERGYAWVKKSNQAFGGRTPVEVMAHGDIFSLARVRAYLDAERGGW